MCESLSRENSQEDDNGTCGDQYNMPSCSENVQYPQSANKTVVDGTMTYARRESLAPLNSKAWTQQTDGARRARPLPPIFKNAPSPVLPLPVEPEEVNDIEKTVGGSKLVEVKELNKHNDNAKDNGSKDVKDNDNGTDNGDEEESEESQPVWKWIYLNAKDNGAEDFKDNDNSTDNADEE